MAWLLGPNNRDSRSISFEFDPPLEISKKKALIIGDQPDSKYQDLHMLVGRPSKGPMPHVFGTFGGPFYVSAQMRQLIDELEPNTHRFFGVTLTNKKTKKYVDEYYYLIPPPVLDAIDPARTYWSRYVGVFDDASDIVLRRKVVFDRHLWRIPPLLPGHSIPTDYFSSDIFRKQCDASKLDGLTFAQHCREV